MAGTWLSKGTT